MEMIVQNLVDNYLAKSGKMIRPQLISLFGEIFSLAQKDIELISRAAEMIHNASLIHDDVIDEAKLRRGEKALNQIVSNSRAVLAGDFLLAKVIAELVESHQFGILKTLAETLQSIVEGEFLQDELKTKEIIGFEELNEVAEKKTGALLSWCCSAAAIVAQKDPETITKCRSIGLKLGVVFQLIDDNLDYSPETGKDYAKDLKEGLINYTTLQLITQNPELYYPVHQLRKTQFTQVPWTEEQLREAQKMTQKKSEMIIEEVRDILNSLQGADTSALFMFMNYLISRHK
jgi:geranylgeranyl pyrophosphate synthase